MDVKLVKSAIKKFAKKHQQTFYEIGSRLTQLFELGGGIGVIQHHRAVGYDISFAHPAKDNRFRIKASSRGHPCDYSRVICHRKEEDFELHFNVATRGAHDDGVYVVDIGAVKKGTIPLIKPKGPWAGISNESLITFAEVKKLTIYPMLLAQFVGIVHEIRPEYLDQPPPEGFGANARLPSTRLALGNHSGNSHVILDGFQHRGFTILVVPTFDMRLSRAAQDAQVSPLYMTHAEI